PVEVVAVELLGRRPCRPLGRSVVPATPAQHGGDPDCHHRQHQSDEQLDDHRAGTPRVDHAPGVPVGGTTNCSTTTCPSAVTTTGWPATPWSCSGMAMAPPAGTCTFWRAGTGVSPAA